MTLKGRTWAVLRSPTLLVVTVVVALSLVPRMLTVGRFTTYDEPLWLLRSSRFADAVTSGSFSEASVSGTPPGDSKAVTMPGVTTMWIGSLARGLWSWGRSLDLWSSGGASFEESRAGLVIAQVLMAVVVSALLGLLTFLVARWAGLGAAAVTGLLLATEPYYVALGSVFHTDALVALSGVASLVAIALALGLPTPTGWQGRWWAAVLAGVLWGVALLTKLTALPFLFGAAVLGGWAVVRAVRAPGGGDEDPDAPDAHSVTPSAPLTAKSVVSMAALAGAGGAAVVVLAYPALWVAPVEELRHLRESASLTGRGHSQFFLGNRTRTPGPLYMFVALPLRMTPWFLVGGVIGGIAVWRRALRGFGAVALFIGLPAFLVVSFASKQSTRYALSVLAAVAIVVGVVVASAVRGMVGGRSWRWSHLVAVGAGALMVLNTVTVAPWGLAYFNPLLGGGATAERAITIGWGEGLEQTGAVIQERERDQCDQVVIWTFPVTEAFPCHGKLLGNLNSYRARPERRDYVVIYVSERLRRPPEVITQMSAGRELIHVVSIRGITYAEVYGPLHLAEPGEP